MELKKPYHVQKIYFDALANPDISGKRKEARWAGARLVTETSHGEQVTLYTGPTDAWDRRLYDMDMIVGDKFWYRDIEEMLRVEGYKTLLPNVDSYANALAVYKNLRHQACGVDNGPMVAVALKKIMN